MKRFIFSLSFSLFALLIYGQITLEECQRKTRENYPLVRQYGLIEKTKEYNLANASKANLPQFTLSGKATWQSEVTELPMQIPGVDIKGLSKDQYQVMLELKQNIWDGGEIRSRKEQVKAMSDVDREKLNVDMYALTERVNQVYFGILLLDEQLSQNQLFLEELERTHRQISSYIENGIASQADLDAVSVEQLNTRQKRIELTTSRQAYLSMLSLLTGEEVPASASLQKPVAESDIQVMANNRPELLWFVQGAYGNPGLNMLKNEFTPYYVAGVRLSWNFGSLYTLRNDRRVIDTSRRQLDSNRDVFLFNTRIQATQQESAVESVRRQMVDDDEIIRLRTNIRKASEAKVANGTMTVTDMLRDMTSENLARQTKALHEVQLLMNIYQLKYTTNN